MAVEEVEAEVAGSGARMADGLAAKAARVVKTATALLGHEDDVS